MKKSLREMMVRIYDSKIIDRFDMLFEEYKNLYPSVNTFSVDLLIRGIESLEREKANIKDLINSGNIFNELKRLTALMDRMIDVGYENYKDSFITERETRTLVSRIYHMILNQAKNKSIPIEGFENGVFDDLPKGFEEITQSLIEEFEAHGNT
ncbi:MAG: hypothetical protein RR247_04310 [Clostridia bacterium]